MQLIDTHSHIYTKEFDNDRTEVIHRSREAGVSRIILPNIDVHSIAPLMDLANRYKGCCVPLMGLHPTSVKDDFRDQLAIIEEHLRKDRFWGVGDIGIDLYWDKTFINQQKDAFRYQVKLAKEMKLPIVIHTRNAFDEIFEVLDDENDDSLSGIFHSFSGNIDHYNHIVGYGGFFIGIGGVITYKNGGLDTLVREMNIEHIVLETDSPYLPPVPHRGKRNESSYIIHVAQKMAEVFNLPIHRVAAITTSNALTLFKLNE